MLDAIRKRIGRIRDAAPGVAARVASRVQAQVVEDIRTRRGNVPSYGPFGDVPPRVAVHADGLRVTVADWAMRRAEERGVRASDWAALVAEEARRAMSGEG